nr:hypothetical protein CFP56_01480 [Quercus suber]
MDPFSGLARLMIQGPEFWLGFLVQWNGSERAVSRLADLLNATVQTSAWMWAWIQKINYYGEWAVSCS